MVLGPLVRDLVDAGFAPVGILAGEAGLRRLRQTGGGSGFDGLLRRFSMSLGAEGEYGARAQQELENGRALVDVEVDDDVEKDLARGVLLRHGGQGIVYFGSWTLETLT